MQENSIKDEPGTDTEISYSPVIKLNGEKKFIDFRDPLHKLHSFTYGKEALSSNS